MRKKKVIPIGPSVIINFSSRFLNRHLENLKKGFIKYEEPFSEIRQNHKGMNITIKLPEVKKKDVLINITQDKIELKAKSIQGGRTLKNYHRIIDIPSCSVSKNIKADYNHKKEVLKIKIPYNGLK